jgi:hypothetical protein
VANTGDINKVIHRNSGLPAKPQSNQALAAHIGEKPELAGPSLTQIKGFPGH